MQSAPCSTCVHAVSRLASVSHLAHVCRTLFVAISPETINSVVKTSTDLGLAPKDMLNPDLFPVLTAVARGAEETSS